MAARFTLVANIKRDSLNVSKFRSDRTGLRVSIANVESPVVSTNICFATECKNDNGLPHCLEHLSFLSNDKYPYQGFLEMAANRCVSSRTDAKTEVDHTRFFLDTGGPDGLLIILPLFLEYLFWPSLKSSQFLTEIHHINADGNDAGVVYSEMKPRESDMESIVEWEFKKLLWPADSGYQKEAGGRLEALRTSTNIDDIKKFHVEYYRPDNCEIIIVGTVDKNKLLEAIIPVDDKLPESRVRPKLVKPWLTPLKPLVSENESDCIESVMQCPSDDEKMGIVKLGWRGPAKDYFIGLAFDTLLKYLSGWFVRYFISSNDPTCSALSMKILDYAELCIELTFYGVKREKLKSIRPSVFKMLEGLKEEDFNPVRMNSFLCRMESQARNEIETEPSTTISTILMKDFLYGSRVTLNCIAPNRVEKIDLYAALRRQPAGFWVKLVRKFLLEKTRPHVCVIGEPKTALEAEWDKREQNRIVDRKQQLGDAGLENCALALAAAVEENRGLPLPPDKLDHYIVPSLEHVRFIEFRNRTNLAPVDEPNPIPASDLPYSAILMECPITKFVEITCLFDTSAVTADKQPYLRILAELLNDTPSANLVSYQSQVGVSGNFLKTICLKLKAASGQFPNVVGLLNDVVLKSKFSADQIVSVCNSLRSAAATSKRNGLLVAEYLSDMLTFQSRSEPLLFSVFVQEWFANNFLKRRLQEDPEVVAEFENLLKEITQVDKVLVVVVSDSQTLTKAPAILKQNFVPCGDPERKFSFATTRQPPVKPSTEFGKGFITGVSNCQSAYIAVTAPGVEHSDADFPALAVLVQYLQQSGGPLYNEIRGRGLAYNVSLSMRSGYLSFSLRRVIDPIGAYRASQRVLENLANFDEARFEAAKRSSACGKIMTEETVEKAAASQVEYKLNGSPMDFNKKLLGRIINVKVADLAMVANRYAKGLFDPARSSIAVACDPSKVQEIVAGFGQLSRDLKVVSLDDDELNKL